MSAQDCRHTCKYNPTAGTKKLNLIYFWTIDKQMYPQLTSSLIDDENFALQQRMSQPKFSEFLYELRFWVLLQSLVVVRIQDI